MTGIANEAVELRAAETVTDADVQFLHVFPYSERPGTPAARMPAVPHMLRRERATRLRDAGKDAARRFFATQIGRTVSLLMESGTAGHSEHFAPVRLSEPSEPGRLLSARVVGMAGEALLAEAA